ncbi:MAG: hypothetical protein QW261_15425 [Candidatus Jordarchaeaceae archaeon]
MPEGKNEITVEGEPDRKSYVLFIKGAIEETAKLYGPIFKRMASNYALEFEAKKLNEEPPENIQGLENVTNYILQNLDRYPQGYCALIYGIAKAESKLQGSTGAGSRRAAFHAIKSILQSSGLMNGLIGSTQDPFEAIDKFENISKAIKTAYPERFLKEENNQIIMILDERCPFRDACTAFAGEKISRVVGGEECVSLITHVAVAEIITKKKFDYKLEKFDTTECRGTIFST